MNSLHHNLLSRLDEHHARVLEIIKRGDALLAPDALPDLGLLGHAREELTSVLSAYQMFKHHELFDPIIRDGPLDKARLAEQMKAECIALGEEYQAHVTRCVDLDIPAHWDSYRPAILRLLARIKAHIGRERWIAASLLIEPVRGRVFGTDLRKVAGV
jgi:hypothetical protein